MHMKISRANLLDGPILKNMLLFTIPLIFSGILQLLFNAADIIVVGKFAGELELAAVGATSSTVNLIVNLCIGFSIGTNVLAARYIGARDMQGVSRTVHSAISLSAIIGILGGAVLFFMAKLFLNLMDTPLDILPSATAYLRAYAVGVPASVVYNFGTAILRAKGDTVRPLYFLIVAGVLNVCLNLIFVLVFQMGAVGVGVATATSQFVSAILVLLCLLHEEGPLRLQLQKLRLHKAETVSIITIGVPASLQSSFFSVSNMIIQSSINSFGAVVVAGNAAAANVEGFVYTAMNAVYQTMLTFTGQNMGARQFKRIDRGLGISCITVSVIGILLGGLVILFDEQILSIYTNDPAVVFWGAKRFLFLALPYFICGVMETIMGAVRGLGYSVFPMCVSLMGACVLRIVWVYTVFAHYRTIESLLISYVVSWILTGSTHFVTYLVVRKRAREKGAPPVAA